MSKLTFACLPAALLLLVTGAGWCQATWEGPTGVFLNPLALTLPPGTTQASVHYLDLQPVGSLSTVGVAYGVGQNWEVGLTHASLATGGTQGLTLFHAKYVVAPAKGDGPQIAVGTILRDGEGDAFTSDFYVAATKVFAGPVPVITSLTIRSTDGLGSGLFGEDDERTTQFGGFLGFGVTPRLILGTEVFGQPDGAAWLDLAFRYNLGPRTFLDGGLARINSAFDDQIAVAVTHQW